ncbi:MAG TPA: VpsF family polysaccharide biosynthesis protein [Alphaproteobacteria bacterium]|nr:VpsF family polysaccharide biosynthesis protein [Alphaproteobacteria bacterium]
MKPDQSLLGDGHKTAGLICLFGFFLHIVLSAPLLNALGFHYSGEEGAFYEKIHPGTVFIFISFIVLLLDRGRPIKALIDIFRGQPAYAALLAIYLLIFVYVVARSGPMGTALLIDTHLTVPICAIVLSSTPISYCRKAVLFFVLVAAINSTIGIVEASTHLRLFEYDPEWSVMKEEHFRASALRGHPLVNAMFTVIAMFVMFALRLPNVIKGGLFLLFTASLIAYGSRSALICWAVGMLVLGGWQLRQSFKPAMSMSRLFALLAVAIAVPAALIGFIALLFYSGLGERLIDAAHWDESANSRVLAMQALHYLSPEEMLLGVSSARIIDITERVNQTVALGGIENPWILMFMYLGLVAFPVWFGATIVFVRRLLREKPLALQLAVLSYFAIATPFNSFGVKDSTYLIMVSAVVCAAHGFYSSPQSRA